MRLPGPFTCILLIFLALQVGFWDSSRKLLPDMSIVPPVPGRGTVQALAFGDEEFYFRVMALRIQNCGDTFGRFTALYKYDFKRLYAWFKLLDELDGRSHAVPAMAAYYFAQTQHTPDVRYVVDYLYEHSIKDPKENWWWLVQASYLANHKLNDKDLALKVAQPLIGLHDIPLWAQQMPAFIHEQRGEFEQAFEIMQNIENDIDTIPPGELRFMRYFVEERLAKLNKKLKSDTKP